MYRSESEDIATTETARQPPRVLVVFYSFSAQTGSLLRHLTDGLKKQGIQVVNEKLRPVMPLRFPIGKVGATFRMMLITCFRRRFAIKELSAACRQPYDLILLGGPTWSYNPSGPVLALLDRDGPGLFAGQAVIPIISCRGYWRLHWYGLRRKLKQCGAVIPNVIIFSHPNSEPWRTIGVFLKLAGKRPERSRLIGNYYKKYGHSNRQLAEATRFGQEIGQALLKKKPLVDLDFKTSLALP